MLIWPFVCSRECSCCFFRFRALRAAVARHISRGHIPSPIHNIWGDPPVLFDETFFFAISSCWLICVSRYFSRFCSMSSCCRRSSMAGPFARRTMNPTLWWAVAVDIRKWKWANNTPSPPFLCQYPLKCRSWVRRVAFGE